MRSLVTRIGIVFAGLMIGALQENWKIDINYILEWSAYVPNYESLSVQDRTQALKSCHPYMPYDYYFNHQSNDWILQMELRQLIQLKWVLTFLFVGVFLVINWLLLLSFKPPVRFLHLLWMAYLATFCFSALAFAISRVLGFANQGYAFVRELIGGLQSMVPGVILCMGYLVYLNVNKLENDETDK
jgi:hypothetical protein